jgi:UDP-N-acetylmuramoylalanine--D-glutamate ligase
MADEAHKRALVVGLGATGLSCARHLAARGHEVMAVDSRAAPPALDRLRAELPAVAVRTGGFVAADFAGRDLLVVSPGVSLREPAIAAAIAAGAEPVGDVELFARALAERDPRPVLAITGSNGKSTVTSLVGAMCRAAGLDAAVGGNIGVPVLDLLRGPPPDCYVLELSSFQLETTCTLNARAAAVLNVSADHMDRYRDLDEYAAAKARIFHGDGTPVLNADDPLVMRLAPPGRARVCFGLGAPQADHDYGVVDRGGEPWLARGARALLPAAELPLPGRHNLANALAAMALAECGGVPFDAMKRALAGFKGLPHRTELVLERDGVRWINDSKGTNVGATVAALSGMREPVILIAGGDGKGADFGALRPAVAAHARGVVLIGRDAPRLAAALEGAAPLVHAIDMEAAVRAARDLARPGDVVLLSPACASFDMYRNYEHRGEVFRTAVHRVLG